MKELTVMDFSRKIFPFEDGSIHWEALVKVILPKYLKYSLS